MGKMTFKVPRKYMEDRNAARRPPHKVLEVFGGGSPYGSTTYKRARLCPFEDGLVRLARLRNARDKEALAIGWIVHQAWEAYYQVIADHQKALGEPPSRRDRPAWERYFWGAQPEAERAGLEVLARFDDEPGYAKTIEDCERVYQAYCEKYRRADEWRVLSVEETLVVEQPVTPAMELVDQDGDVIRYDTWRYSARLDVVVERWDTPTPSLWVVEHKTAKMITDDLLHGYQLDMQILGQVWLVHHCVDLTAYAPYRGVIVNIATKHKTPRFERVEVCPSPEHLEAFEVSTKQWGLMREVYAGMGYPRALGTCAGALRGYSRCDYYDLCHSRPTWSVEDFAREEPPHGFYRDEQTFRVEDDMEDY